jgi:MSHA pilin protein MshA
MKGNKGFTLIELIIVIVILGILAAYAIPKYMNIDKQARTSVVRGMEGSLKAAAEMVHAIAVSSGDSSSTNIGTGSVNITSNRYPTADNAGILAAISDNSGFIAVNSSNNVAFQKSGAPTVGNNCAAFYDISSGAPVVTNVTSGC